MVYMNQLKINNRIIGSSCPTYFIADIAANHDGDLDRAKSLIKMAAGAGASAVKFQHFRASHIISKRGFGELNEKLSHQKYWQKSIFQTYDDASLPWEWTASLAQVASDAGVDFFTAPYDLEAIDFVDKFIPAYKVGSGDITWTDSIKMMASKGKPIFLATGASKFEDVVRAVEVIRVANVPFCLMQCNTNYSGMAENRKFANINVLKTYAREFPEAILGLSDHTTDNFTVLAAIALGACAVEKHFTDDSNRSGPDHAFSLNPQMWKKMVEEAEILRETLGDGLKKIEFNEEKTVIIQRRALRFIGSFPRGHVIKESDLTSTRPCPTNGIPPFRIHEVIGRKLNEQVFEDQLVDLSYLL